MSNSNLKANEISSIIEAGIKEVSVKEVLSNFVGLPTFPNDKKETTNHYIEKI